MSKEILFVCEMKTSWKVVVFHSVVKCLICFEAFDCLQIILNFMSTLAVPFIT